MSVVRGGVTFALKTTLTHLRDQSIEFLRDHSVHGLSHERRRVSLQKGGLAMVISSRAEGRGQSNIMNGSGVGEG